MDEATRNIVRAMPPGFRFQPSDEELLVHYLRPKAESNPLPASIIADLHICQYDPWDLPAKAIYGEQEWYFFSSRERKYPNGSRPNRVAISGFWKAIGTDKPITASPPNSHIKLGVKKTLVFFKGRPPTGIKTDWIMHEYRLTNIATTPTNTASSSSSSFGATQSLRLDGWVLCRIYKKQHASLNCSRQQPPSNVEEMLERLPDISDMPIPMNMFFGVDTNSLFANDKCNV